MTQQPAHTYLLTHIRTLSWAFASLEVIKILACSSISIAQNWHSENWRWCTVDMSGNITLCEKNRGLLCCTGSCNITLFVVLHFLCTSVSECAYRCCAALITLYPSYSRTSFVKPREEKCNYILLTLSANKETGFLYLGFYKSLSIIKWAKCT